jgi:hypothetical protein
MDSEPPLLPPEPAAALPWRSGLVLLWMGGLAALAVANAAVLTVFVPKMERILRDMMPGAPCGLPLLTEGIMAWSRTTPLCLLAVAALAAAGIVPLVRAKPGRSGVPFAAVCAVLLIVLLATTVLGMHLPLVTVIQHVMQKP